MGSQAQLFVDRVLVRESRGVAYAFHTADKHPGNPLVRGDLPWEGWRIKVYNVIYDEDESTFRICPRTKQS